MNAIDILEQQQANEVLRLEIAYSNLYRAYLSDNRNKMIRAIDSALANNPSHATSLQDGMDRIFTENYGLRWGKKSSWLLVSNEDVKLNAEGCMRAIHSRLSDITFYKKTIRRHKRFYTNPTILFTSMIFYMMTLKDSNLKLPTCLPYGNMP